MDNITVSATGSFALACYIIHEIVFIVFAAAAIFLDVLIIWTIAKTDKLKTVTNIYLANWAFVDVINLIVTPSAYSIIALLDNITVYGSVFSMVFKLAIIIHVTLNASVVIVIFDWLIATYRPALLETLKYYYKLVLGILWISAIMLTAISLATCKRFFYCYLGEYELLATFGFVILLVAVVQIAQLIRKCRKLPPPNSVLRLNLASLFVAVWIFGFSNLIFLKWAFDHPLVSLLMDCVTFSTSFINISLLYYYDSDFHEGLLGVLKRNRYTERLYHFKNPLIHRIEEDVES